MFCLRQVLTEECYFLTLFPVVCAENYCYQPLAGPAVNMSTNQYPIFPITPAPGAVAMAPSPALAVADPPINYFVPESSPNPLAPGVNPSSAVKLPVSLFSSVVLAIILIFTL